MKLEAFIHLPWGLISFCFGKSSFKTNTKNYRILIIMFWLLFCVNQMLLHSFKGKVNELKCQYNWKFLIYECKRPILKNNKKKKLPLSIIQFNTLKEIIRKKKAFQLEIFQACNSWQGFWKNVQFNITLKWTIAVLQHKPLVDIILSNSK